MIERLQERLMRLLKVPPVPRPPDGEAGTVRVFRAAPAYFRYIALSWVIKQIGAFIGLLVSLGFVTGMRQTFDDPTVSFWLVVGESLIWIGFLLQLPASWLMLRLDYDLRWYIVTDRCLRIREGLLHVREQTLTFANIQQISVQQGPLQRYFGIADVEVRTAGGGDSGQDKQQTGTLGQSMHVGYFRGVDNASEIRDLLRARVGRHRDAGLGDPDDATPELAPETDAAPAPAAVTLLEAANELGAAAAELRQARARHPV
jgi:membrane protein YdbS with pleckstrin-like domain